MEGGAGSVGAAVVPSAGARAAAEGTRGVGGREARYTLGLVVAAAAAWCTAGGVVSDQFELVPRFVCGSWSGALQCEEDVSELEMFSRDELGWNMCRVRRG